MEADRLLRSTRRRMKHRWVISRKKGDAERFFACSEAGRSVGFMTLDGLVSFLTSRGASEVSIRQTLYDLDSSRAGSRVRVELDEGWH